jgi:hypothetical protein
MLHVLQQLEQRVQTGVRDILLEVLERPDDRVDDQLELPRGRMRRFNE